jgi:hypothetical protein
LGAELDIEPGKSNFSIAVKKTDWAAPEETGALVEYTV